MDLTNEWSDGDDYAYYNQGSSDDEMIEECSTVTFSGESTRFATMMGFTILS
jgi:hypothetical protein